MPVVIFKAVERCNSNCVYCDVIKKRQDLTMSLETLECVFRRIDEYLREHPGERVTFTWHGGEIGLLRADYFRHAREYQERHCPGTHDRIDHLVQSNLTLVTQELLDALRALGVEQIGSSFDPIPHIRGFGSRRDSDKYNRRFLAGVELLNANGMAWGVIYVVHRQSLAVPLDIFYFLTNLNVRTQPNFNPVYIYGEDPLHLAITGEEFADFLGAMFPVWWSRRDRFPEVKPFKGLVDNVRNRGGDLVCERSGGCANEWVYIGPDGVTAQCGRGGDYGVAGTGNIRDRALRDILHDPKREPLVRRQWVLARTECAGCRFWGICHGGCPLDAYMTHRGYYRRAPTCDGLRIFMERYFEPITGLRAEFPPPPTSDAEVARA
jgi:serine-type anaerobic sulfatase-maturating enzyme